MTFIPFAFSRTLKHTRPRYLPQKEEDHPRQRMVEDIPSRRNSALPSKKAYPQSALRLTAPSAERAFRQTPRKASPERGGARRRRAEGFVPSTAKVAAALSAAVDSRKLQETAPTFRRNQLCRNAHPKRQPLFGREREGGASLREAASLAIPPSLFPRKGRAREGETRFSKRVSPSRSF